MDKYIIKSCFHLMNSTYADGREIVNECGDSLCDEKCVDKHDCFLKQIADNLLRVVNSGQCGRCDGCGLETGCADKECGVYTADKCLQLLKLEFEGEEEC